MLTLIGPADEAWDAVLAACKAAFMAMVSDAALTGRRWSTLSGGDRHVGA